MVTLAISTETFVCGFGFPRSTSISGLSIVIISSMNSSFSFSTGVRQGVSGVRQGVLGGDHSHS